MPRRRAALAAAAALACALTSPRAQDSTFAPGLDTLRVQPSAVSAEAVRLFGDAPTFDIDVANFAAADRVAYFIARFQGEARERFAAMLRRGGRYEPMIRGKLRAAKLPEDLTYLALIESGYEPDAYSRAAAVGIWQLMSGTARDAGLRVDWWVDERRDPVRATDGATRVLRWLGEQFGSMYLAAAAYNGGAGRVSRALTRYADRLDGRTGDSAFFALAATDYLRAETRDYVPKLIAAALVAKDPVRYGFDRTVDAPLAYDSVRAPGALPLLFAAKAAQVPLDTIRSLNNAILRGITPPRASSWLRVPVGTARSVDSAIGASSAAARAAGKRVELAHGGTIAAVAARFGLSSRQLIWYNPSWKRARPGTKVSAGEAVFVPNAAALAGARDVPDPAIERYPHAKARRATHVVREGETLATIAGRYGTSVKALKRLNGLHGDTIHPGEVLVIRGRKG